MEKFQIVASEGCTLEDAMLEFNSVYIPINSISDRFKDLPESQRNSIYGKAAQTVDSRINKEAKELGLTLDGKLHDNVESVINAYKAQITELNESIASLKDNTDKASKNEIEKLTQKVNDLTSLNAKLTNDLENVSNEKQTIEAKYTEKELEIIINHAKELAKKEVILVDNADKRELVENDYNRIVFKVDENKNTYAVDANGNAIISKVNAGKFADPTEIYNDIVAKREAYKKTSGNGNAILDKSQNTNQALPNRHNMASNIKLGK